MTDAKRLDFNCSHHKNNYVGSTMPAITHYINVSRQHFVHPKLTGMLCVNYTPTIKKNNAGNGLGDSRRFFFFLKLNINKNLRTSWIRICPPVPTSQR